MWAKYFIVLFLLMCAVWLVLNYTDFELLIFAIASALSILLANYIAKRCE